MHDARRDGRTLFGVGRAEALPSSLGARASSLEKKDRRPETSFVSPEDPSAGSITSMLAKGGLFVFARFGLVERLGKGRTARKICGMSSVGRVTSLFFSPKPSRLLSPLGQCLPRPGPF